MAEPIYDPNPTIRRSSQNIQDNLNNFFDTALKNERMKVQRAEQAFDGVRAIKKELGKLGREYVQEEITTTLDKMKGDILKDRKRNGTEIDMSAIGDYQEEINRLSNLAQNTKIYDQLYEDFEQDITAAKHVKGGDFGKQIIRRRAMDLFADKDSLAENNPQEMAAKLQRIYESQVDRVGVVLDYIDIGDNTVSIKDPYGRTTTTSAPSVMVYNEETGEFDVDQQAMTQVIDTAYNRAGISATPEEANALEETIKRMATTKRAESNPNKADQEYKEIRNENAQLDQTAKQLRILGLQKELSQVDIDEEETSQSLGNSLAEILVKGGNTEKTTVLADMAKSLVSGLDGIEIEYWKADSNNYINKLDRFNSERIPVEKGKNYLIINGKPIATGNDTSVEEVFSTIMDTKNVSKETREQILSRWGELVRDSQSTEGSTTTEGEGSSNETRGEFDDL